MQDVSLLLLVLSMILAEFQEDIHTTDWKELETGLLLLIMIYSSLGSPFLTASSGLKGKKTLMQLNLIETSAYQYW